MNKNFTKNKKKLVLNKREIYKETLSPSKKTIDFILSYSKSTKSILDKKVLNFFELKKQIILFVNN